MGTTKSAFISGILRFYDSVTNEITLPLDPLWWYDDFMGAGHTVIPTTATAGSYWGSKIVKAAGNVTVAAVANGVNGQILMTTDATSEKQDAVLYCLDQRAWTVTAAFKYEARASLPVFPTSGTKAVWGMAAAWADGPNNIAQYVRFAVNGSGAILCETQDGTTQLSVASGVSFASTTDWHIFRIDMTDVTNVKFYIDGTQVATSQVFPFAATGTAAQMQPYSRVYTASGTSVGQLALDFVSLFGSRG